MDAIQEDTEHCRGKQLSIIDQICEQCRTYTLLAPEYKKHGGPKMRIDATEVNFGEFNRENRSCEDTTCSTVLMGGTLPTRWMPNGENRSLGL